MTTESWIVELETGSLEQWPSDEQLDAFADAIFRSKALAGPVPAANLATHTLSLRTAVDAETGDDAVNRAVIALYLAARRGAMAPPKIVDITVALDPGDGIDPQELVSGGDVARRLGVSRERVRQLAEDPARFPRPRAVIGRDRVWRWGDIAKWATGNDRKTKTPRRRRAIHVAGVALRGSSGRFAATKRVAAAATSIAAKKGSRRSK